MLQRTLAVAILVASATAEGQRIPGRDLLTYPLGLSGEPAAFAEGAASGLWNPATAVLQSGERGRIGIAALNAPIDLSLTAQVINGALQTRRGTVSMSIARAAITNLAHTETDPQSVGTDVPYNTWVLSGGWAQRLSKHVVAGAAARWHTGHVYQDRRSTAGADAGVIIDGITRRDIRVGASSFLMSFGHDAVPSVSAAIDGRIAGPDTLRSVRAGLSFLKTRGSASERYPFLEARAGKVSLRGGPVQVVAFGSTTWRLRLAFIIRRAGYSIGVVREDNESGLAPTYQLGIANVFR